MKNKRINKQLKRSLSAKLIAHNKKGRKSVKNTNTFKNRLTNIVAEKHAGKGNLQTQEEVKRESEVSMNSNSHDF